MQLEMRQLAHPFYPALGALTQLVWARGKRNQVSFRLPTHNLDIALGLPLERPKC